MEKRYPCGGIGRRHFLGGIGAAASIPILSSLGINYVSAQEPKAARNPHAIPDKPGVPGPFRGRVIEARNPGMINNGAKSREAVKATVGKGLMALTGADDAVSAWRAFFEPGDVVGIKVVPNGWPNAHTSHELVLQVIDGLKSAGVKTSDIFVYERYRREFMKAKYQDILPENIKWGGLTPGNDPAQMLLDFPAFRNDPIAGYDRDEFMQMNLVPFGHDPRDDRAYRSHLGKFITKTVNKIVGLPVLKDHGSAGVTGALKNMSHGSVNNVARSHSTSDTNACNQFIPQVVSHPIIRQKFVLQIMDGIRGVFQGGPFAGDIKNTWEYNALLFATDPVALDHVEWRIIDEKRVAMKLPPVASSGKLALDPLQLEGFDVRQPQHIALAANLGLGIFDFDNPKGRKYSIDHRVVSV
jgi:hypothetical protein